MCNDISTLSTLSAKQTYNLTPPKKKHWTHISINDQHITIVCWTIMCIYIYYCITMYRIYIYTSINIHPWHTHKKKLWDWYSAWKQYKHGSKVPPINHCIFYSIRVITYYTYSVYIWYVCTPVDKLTPDKCNHSSWTQAWITVTKCCLENKYYYHKTCFLQLFDTQCGLPVISWRINQLILTLVISYYIPSKPNR